MTQRRALYVMCVVTGAHRTMDATDMELPKTKHRNGESRADSMHEIPLAPNPTTPKKPACPA